MPRFFFHVYDDLVAHDDEGIVLPNAQAAKLQALMGARELMQEQLKHGYISLDHWIDVINEQGAIILHLPFGEAVEIRAGATTRADQRNRPQQLSKARV